MHFDPFWGTPIFGNHRMEMFVLFSSSGNRWIETLILRCLACCYFDSTWSLIPSNGQEYLITIMYSHPLLLSLSHQITRNQLKPIYISINHHGISWIYIRTFITLTFYPPISPNQNAPSRRVKGWEGFFSDLLVPCFKAVKPNIQYWDIQTNPNSNWNLWFHSNIIQPTFSYLGNLITSGTQCCSISSYLIYLLELYP